MKKSTMILSALLLAGAGFSAQAQSTEDGLFIVGNFNDYNADDDDIWTLNLIPDVAEEGADVYRGTFNIATGEVSFYLDYNGIALVPGMLVDGEIQQAESNANVLSDDDFYEGYFATSGFSGENGLHWVINNWPGGNLEVTVDFTNQTIALSSAEYQEEPGYVAYIVGNFNDWDPQDLSIWALNLVPGTEDTFRGTFTLAQGNVEFYINYNGISLVPGFINGEGEIEAKNGGQAYSNEYEGLFATTGFASLESNKWYDLGWQGGNLEVTVNFSENTIIIGVPQEEPMVANVFIAGNFNDFAPEGLEMWQLGATNKEGVYELDFEFPEIWIGKQLQFYFLVENISVVPGVLEDGEYVWEAADVAVLDGADEFVGNWATVGFPQYFWTTEYEGGVLGFSLNLNNNEVKFNKGGYSAINTIKANIEDGAIYNLQGVRVSKDNLAKGIYVINGKKVLVK